MEKNMKVPVIDYVTYYISSIFRHSAAHIDRKLGPMGLSVGSFPTLLMSYFHRGINQQLISELMVQDKATTARSVRKVIDLGLVERVKSEDDLRAYKLYPTAKGEGLVGCVIGSLEEWNSVLTDGFSEEEIETTKKMLNRMLENAKRHHMRLKGEKDA